MAEIKTISYESWQQLKTELFPELFGVPYFVRDRYLFRGQANGDWSLLSSFDRWFAVWGGDRNREVLARDLVSSFLENAEDQGHDLRLAPDQIEAVALAQHYGLPTRLLDWTESPYVASYFAFQNYVHLTEEIPDTVAIWALNKSSNIWKSVEGTSVFRPPRLSNIRLRNQAGWFTLSRSSDDELEQFVERAEADEIGLWRILLPSDCGLDAISDLMAMVITPARLFPELEGAAAYAVLRATMLVRPR